MFGSSKPLEELPQLEDGTNVLFDTEYFYQERCISEWYVPRDATATPRWREKLQRIQDQFDAIARNYRPQSCVLVQSRVPAFGDMPDPMIWIDGEDKLLSGGGGLGRDVSFLMDSRGHQLFCDFPIKDIHGKPICNSAGDAYAIRLGLSRMHFVCKGPNYVHESRRLHGPQLVDVAREAAGILFGVPASISSVIWKNWKSGFHRKVCEYTWFDALFELAWQHPQGSSLVATRQAWKGHTSVQLKGDGLFPRIPEIWLESLATASVPHEHGYPLCFFSKIDDLARASVSMIDVLLELPDQPEALSPCTNTESDRRNIASAVVPEISVTRDQVFISYSHQDKKFLGELVTHLKPFARNGSVTHWSDEQIEAGSKWFAEIQTALAKAKVAVLLVTKDFLASDFIHDHELGPLLKQAEAGGVSIRWILVGACSYQETPLKHDQAVVSPPSKPLAQMKKADRDAAWVQICQEIKKAANQ